MKLKCQTAEKWLEEMKDMPCYCPCPPFYDFCNHMFQQVKRLDCEKCIKEHNLRDYIE